jgi:tetratricopeptide (TPR) repeat protein
MPDDSSPLRPWLVLTVLLVAVAVAFIPTLQAPFLIDDYWRVVGNERLTPFWPPWRHFVDASTSSAMQRLVQFRPLLPLSFSVDLALWGGGRLALRATNVLLHSCVVLMSFGFVRELLAHWSHQALSRRSIDGAALTVAALVAVHPLAAYTVNYISARDLVLAQIGLLAVLWGYAHYRRAAPPAGSRTWVGWWVVMLVAFSAAMLAKQNVVVLPALLVLFDVFAGRESLRRRALWLRPLPFVVLIAAWVLWSRLAMEFSEFDNLVGSFSPSVFAFTQAKLHATEYIAALFWPVRLRYFGMVTLEQSLWNVGTVVGVVLVIASLLVAWRLRTRAPLVGLGIMSYWVLMALESSVLPVANIFMPYRQYPALLFVGLPLVLAVRGATAGARSPALVRTVLASIAVLAALGVTLINSVHWRTEDAFWTHAVSYGGDHRAHMNLAAAINDPLDPRVQRHLREAQALMVGRDADEVSSYALLPGLDHVVSRFEADLGAARDTTRGRVHFWRAHAHREAGRRVQARAEADRAADVAPHIASYQWYAAMDAQNAEDWSRVVVLAQRMEGLDTDPSSVAFLGGAALQNLGRNQEAIDWYLRYLSLPAEESSLDGRRMVTMNLALAATAIGRCELARPQLLERQREQPTEAVIAGLLAACPER